MVTTKLESYIHGMTVNACMSVSLEPPFIAVSLSYKAHRSRLLLKGRPFGASILDETQHSFSIQFAGRPVDGLGVAFVTRKGTPLLEVALAHIVAHVTTIHPAGDHSLYVAAVKYMALRSGRPLLFYGGTYPPVAI